MGKPIAITNMDHSAEDLRALAAKTKDAAVVRRILALALLLDGKSREEAAWQNGMQRQTLRDWVHRYNAEGVAGLSSRTAPGPKPSLSDQQMAELKALVIAGPDPATDGVGAALICASRSFAISRSSCTNAASASCCASST